MDAGEAGKEGSIPGFLGRGVNGMGMEISVVHPRETLRSATAGSLIERHCIGSSVSRTAGEAHDMVSPW